MVGCVEQQTSHTVEEKTFDIMTIAFFKAVCMSNRDSEKSRKTLQTILISEKSNNLDLRKVKLSWIGLQPLGGMQIA